MTAATPATPTAPTDPGALPVTLTLADAEDILWQLLDDMREFNDQFAPSAPLPGAEAEALYRHAHALAALAQAIAYARLGRPGAQPGGPLQTPPPGASAS